MIEYICGKIAELTPTFVIIDNHGIGYELNISLNTFSELEQNSEVKILIHEVIREDAHMLFGFATANERALFRELIGVSGVGANTARMILSSIPPAELEQTISSGDDKRLKSVKGVGAKTAQRIIVDLRDKIKVSDSALFTQVPISSRAYEEALQALLMLGFTKPLSEKALKKLFSDSPAITVEDAVKRALKML